MRSAVARKERVLPMKMRSITGLDKPLSQLSLGTAWFDDRYEAEINRLLDAYVELGGTILDTGRFYNGGKSEPIVARWLERSGCRERLVITNKACHHYVDENNVHHTEQSRVRPQCITEDLHHSLERMKLDCFDIYLLHRDDAAQPVEGLIDRLEKHRREGLIKVYGVSNWSLDRIAEAQAYAKRKGYRGIQVNSPSYSLATIVKPRFEGCVYADDAYIEWHRDKDITLIAWASLAVGFFADAYKRDGSAPKDIVDTYFCEENFQKLERAKVLAAQKGVESIHIALAYALGRAESMICAIGPRNEGELRSLMRASSLGLSEEEMRWLKGCGHQE